MQVRYLVLVIALLYLQSSIAQELVFAQKAEKRDFPLFSQGRAADIVVDGLDYPVVRIAANLLAKDVQAVTTNAPRVVESTGSLPRHVVILGTVEKNGLIRKLIRDGKIGHDSLHNKWESCFISVVVNPFPGVKSALVIAGSDRRGAAYGAVELSRRIGVSPFVWWADVPVTRKSQIIIRGGTYYYGPPAVKYRGIFINDESWGIQQWASVTQDTVYKDLGPNAYARIFELMLRLKANYFWPAKATPFNAKPENAELADQYAIVRGGAHNAPMLGNTRKEWDESRDGPWNYATNAEKIRAFWQKRIRNFHQYENVYTIGMRGSGDLPMGGGESIDERVDLLQRIINDQRTMLSEELKKDVTEIPQAFVAYKEVLDLYDRGLQLPEDVVLVWPDDNYGYMLRLPDPNEQQRAGGNGIYFHLSYLGRPHDYLWLSTTSPMHIWTELSKAYAFNARQLWVVNVGDIKPAEYEFQLAMDLAWHADSFGHERVGQHLKDWLVNAFGIEAAEEIFQIKQQYYQLAFIRRPEFMGWSRIEPNTPVVDTEFSDINYGEAEKRFQDYQRLQRRVMRLAQTIPENQKEAFYQLVYYPVLGASLMNKKFLTAQKNRWYARQGRSSSNALAKLAMQYHDSLLMITEQYESLKSGKWRDMASYDDLPFAVYKSPPVQLVTVNDSASWDVWVEGNSTSDGSNVLRVFNEGGADSVFFEIYNKGSAAFSWTAVADQPWIRLTQKYGQTLHQQRVFVTIDFTGIPVNQLSEGNIQIADGNTSRSITVLAKRNAATAETSSAFREKDGVATIAATSFHRKIDRAGYRWTAVPGIGLTGKMMTTLPVTSPPVDHEWEVAKNAPYLSYDFNTSARGWFDVLSFTLPTHAVNRYRSCMYGLSIDDGPPLIIDFSTQNRSEQWKENVSRNSARIKTRHYIEKTGKHTLKVWLIDTGVYFDKFILDFGGLKDSYLGPEAK